MRKVLVVNVPGLHNLGGMGIVFGAIKSLENSLNDVKITFSLSHYENESQFYNENFGNIEVIPHFWYREHKSLVQTYILSFLGFFSQFIRCISFRYLKVFNSPYSEYDIIIDLNSDALNEHYSLIQPVYSLFNIWFPIICKKPVVIAAASIGPFNNTFLKYFAKKTLINTRFILAREKRTRDYLLDLGIPNEKLGMVGDHAFLMTPINSKEINVIFKQEELFKLKKPIVGISPSELISKYGLNDTATSSEKYDAYKLMMTSLIDYIIEKLHASVVIIPHSYQESENDQIISSKIYNGVSNKENAVLLKSRYKCNELKGLIGKCEMFIGCRMHSTIASTSMCVPTIALVYGHKSHGILGDCLGLESFLIPMEDYSSCDDLSNALFEKVNHVWEERESIQNHLKERLPLVQKAALKNGQIIKKELEVF